MTERCTAVIVAAGNAVRMGGVDKILAPILGEPVIVHSVRAFERCRQVTEIVVVTRADRIPAVKAALSGMTKVSAVVAGGAERADSVRAGLAALPEDCALVAVHDGARPCVTGAVIEAAISAAARCGAAVPAIPARDTIYCCDNGAVTEIPERSRLMGVQTPQVLRRTLLEDALEAAAADGVPLTDDGSAVFRMGRPVELTAGSPENLKITTPVDLMLAGEILRGRRNG